MTLSKTSASFKSCNNGGNQCGSTTVLVTLLNAPAGTVVSASSVPSNLTVTQNSALLGVYTFTIKAKNNTRTTNDVYFSGCGSPKSVSITTTN